MKQGGAPFYDALARAMMDPAEGRKGKKKNF